jgi:hypothetical protein
MARSTIIVNYGAARARASIQRALNTEVLLTCMRKRERSGDRVARHVALTICDTRTKPLLLTSFGIKPLFYAPDANVFSFCQ